MAEKPKFVLPLNVFIYFYMLGIINSLSTNVAWSLEIPVLNKS